MGYAFIFSADIPALYEGVSEDVRAKICKRAHGMCKTLEAQPKSAHRDRKIALLKELISKDQDDPNIRLMF